MLLLGLLLISSVGADNMENVFNVTAQTETVCGGPGGTAFDDQVYYDAYSYPTEVLVSAVSTVDMIQFYYGGVPAEAHGGSGGTLEHYVLREGEYLCGVSFKQMVYVEYDGTFVCEISFYVMRDGEIFEWGPWGLCNSQEIPVSCETYIGAPLQYIRGRSSQFLDYLEVIFE